MRVRTRGQFRCDFVTNPLLAQSNEPSLRKRLALRRAQNAAG
jgi:hypothetical protein